MNEKYRAPQVLDRTLYGKQKAKQKTKNPSSSPRDNVFVPIESITIGVRRIEISLVKHEYKQARELLDALITELVQVPERIKPSDTLESINGICLATAEAFYRAGIRTVEEFKNYLKNPFRVVGIASTRIGSMKNHLTKLGYFQGE